VLGFHGAPCPQILLRNPWPCPGSAARTIEAQFRAKAKIAHPDLGGSDSAMAELIAAREEALKAYAA